MFTHRTNFAANLRFACSTHPSVAGVCREIGINRQQFNRYLSGKTLPSAYNTGLIARYFGISAEDFELSEMRFRAMFESPDGAGPRAADTPLSEAFPGDMRRLRAYLGYYELFHKSLSWPGKIVRSCARLRERDGQVEVKTVERMYDQEQEFRQVSKYLGQAAFWRNRLFIVERGLGQQPIVCETILMPFGEYQRNYLRGVTIGVSWRRENLPYSGRTIWRSVGSDPDLRRLLQSCGVLSEKSRKLPLPVRRYLNEVENEAVTAS